ncbi:hypothetical protein FQA39_LY09518 [Lamprigera yunnana]|nr:hypothetical protein FQA39_LY09518 [Lamprigera yunnana]
MGDRIPAELMKYGGLLLLKSIDISYKSMRDTEENTCGMETMSDHVTIQQSNSERLKLQRSDFDKKDRRTHIKIIWTLMLRGQQQTGKEDLGS